MITRYKIFWQSRLSPNTKGESTEDYTFSVARFLASGSNRRYPFIDYWVSDASYDFEQAKNMRF